MNTFSSFIIYCKLNFYCSVLIELGLALRMSGLGVRLKYDLALPYLASKESGLLYASITCCPRAPRLYHPRPACIASQPYEPQCCAVDYILNMGVVHCRTCSRRNQWETSTSWRCSVRLQRVVNQIINGIVTRIQPARHGLGCCLYLSVSLSVCLCVCPCINWARHLLTGKWLFHNHFY